MCPPGALLLALAGHAAREVEGGFSPWCTADIPGGVGSLWQTPFCGWVKTELYCLLAEIAARPEYLAHRRAVYRAKKQEFLEAAIHATE